MTEQFEKRCDKLFAMGLKYNGSEFYLDDINIHWTEVSCDNDKEFNEKCDRIQLEIKRRKSDDRCGPPAIFPLFPPTYFGTEKSK